MKRLNIIASVGLLVCTIGLDVLFPFIIPFGWDKLAIVSCANVLGFMGAYLYFDNYCELIIDEQRQENYKAWRDAFDQGYDLGYKDAKRINAG